jgi:mannose-6-phosphate isomerase-like protein (cupin superfamily)
MYFVTNIEKETLENEDYRRVIWTTGYRYMQLVLMSIPVGQDIELEVHKEADQFIRIEQGRGELHIGEHEETKIPIKDGFAMIIERNTYHRVVNVGNIPLKLYTVYTQAQHRPDTIEKFRPKSEKGEKGEKGKKREERKGRKGREERKETKNKNINKKKILSLFHIL